MKNSGAHPFDKVYCKECFLTQRYNEFVIVTLFDEECCYAIFNHDKNYLLFNKNNYDINI